MQKLTDKVLVRLIKETYEEHKQKIKEELDVIFPIDGEKGNVLSKGLKLRNKKGELFTIDSIGDWGAYLTPSSAEGESVIKVDTDELEDSYEL